MPQLIDRRTLIALLASAAASASFPVLAGPDPRQTIETMVRDALKLLRDQELKKKPVERRKKIREIADRAFDWEAMARSSIGHYWRDLTDAQRSDFVNVFKDLIARQYMNDVDRFQGNEDVKIVGAAPKDDLFIIKTQLITSSNEKVPMDYTLHKVNSNWQIEDLSIEGVSMVKHYRQSFKRFLVNKSFAELLDVLKKKLG